MSILKGKKSDSEFRDVCISSIEDRYQVKHGAAVEAIANCEYYGYAMVPYKNGYVLATMSGDRKELCIA